MEVQKSYISVHMRSPYESRNLFFMAVFRTSTHLYKAFRLLVIMSSRPTHHLRALRAGHRRMEGANISLNHPHEQPCQRSATNSDKV